MNPDLINILAFLGVLVAIFIFITFIFAVCDAIMGSHPHRRDFDEPATDTVFQADERGPLLVECDTAGDPTPPNEVMVHRYRWNAALSAYEYIGHIPLSRYAIEEEDLEIEQILGRGPQPPTTWDHQRVFPGRSEPLSESGL